MKKNKTSNDVYRPPLGLTPAWIFLKDLSTKALKGDHLSQKSDISELGWEDKFLEKQKVQPGIFTTHDMTRFY